MKNYWIKLHSGIKMNPFEAKVEDICLEDIAHALSNICRYTGHCSEFYSVAQHSVYVSVYSSNQNALWGLLHDASEAYLCDIARPVKRSELLSGYCEAEENLMKVIAKKFGLCWPMPEETKNLDSVFLMTEAMQLGMWDEEWPKYAEPLTIPIYPQLPKSAYQSFIDWFGVLQHRRNEIKLQLDENIIALV